MPPSHHLDQAGSRSATRLGRSPRHALPSAGSDAFTACTIALNRLLADTSMLRDLYRKHRWQVEGAGFYPLHLLYEEHCAEQSELIDRVAERIVALGGRPWVMARDIAENASIPMPPPDGETASAQLDRLLRAHNVILTVSHGIADWAAMNGDRITGALIASDVVRLNERQVWLLLEQSTRLPPLRCEH